MGRKSENAPHRVEIRLTTKQIEKLDAIRNSHVVHYPTSEPRPMTRTEAVRKLIEDAAI